MLVVFSPQQRRHQPLQFVSRGRARAHPDVPERIDALLEGVRDGCHELVEPRDHGARYIGRIHTPRYLEFLQESYARWRELDAGDTVLPNVHPPRSASTRYPRSIVGRTGRHMIDMACPIDAQTWPAILWNSHSAAEAALRVADGSARSAYALCRPPGHHAGPDYAAGFCYLNNAALAASILHERFGRLAVLDVDVHHGNGTQDIFYTDRDVLVASLHGDPNDFYPFYWGYADETGADEAGGANLNIPLPKGMGDAAYLGELAHALERIRAFGAGALVVSLGLDAYEHDPFSWLEITTAGFERIGAEIGALGLPTVLVQEGGYFCEHLGRNLAAFLCGFEHRRGALGSGS